MRYQLIDPALTRAGWNLDDRTQVRFEVPVDGYDAEPWNGVTDYCLYELIRPEYPALEGFSCNEFSKR